MEELEPEPEDRHYYCAICKGLLDYLDGSDTIWECDSCFQFYDTKIQDLPIKDKEDFKLAPFYDLQHYPQGDDENSPFFEAINPNDREENLETRTFEDKRVQKIHIKGSFADAIVKGALTSKKNDEDRE